MDGGGETRIWWHIPVLYQAQKTRSRTPAPTGIRSHQQSISRHNSNKTGQYHKGKDKVKLGKVWKCYNAVIFIFDQGDECQNYLADYECFGTSGREKDIVITLQDVTLWFMLEVWMLDEQETQYHQLALDIISYIIYTECMWYIIWLWHLGVLYLFRVINDLL